MQEFIVETIDQTAHAASVIAEAFVFPACVYLHGDMGAGKTTLTKHILRHLGYQKAVTSPTYNLIQEYPVPKGVVYHMDLYRLDDPSEVESLALEDLWSDQCLFLIEWPQKGAGFLPPATFDISLQLFRDSGAEKRKIMLNI